MLLQNLRMFSYEICDYCVGSIFSDLIDRRNSMSNRFAQFLSLLPLTFRQNMSFKHFNNSAAPSEKVVGYLWIYP